MEITNDTLYVAEVEDEKSAHQTESEAIDDVENSINGDIEEENVKIFEVNIEDNEWSIIQVPWSKIALEMMKNDS